MKHQNSKMKESDHRTLSLDFVTPIAERRYIHDTEKRRVVSQILNMITERERQVLTLKSIGFDYNEIAEEINVSPKLAENIMEKLRMRMIALFPEVATVYGAEVCYV
jgi:DNA-directed RNA polymerase specialized sigma24 family protein